MPLYRATRDVDSDAGADWPVRRGLTPVRSRLWRQGGGGCRGMGDVLAPMCRWHSPVLTLLQART